MTTRLAPAGDADALAEAARLLQNGQVVGMPTETVYGLAADATDEEAVERIFAAKGRPQDNPLIVHIADKNMLDGVVSGFSADAQKLADAFWPGPLTMVLPKGDAVAPAVSAGLATVGVRWPAHKAAQALILAAGLPLAAPSANRSGSPSPTTAAHVLADMDGRIPMILDGGASPVGVESTVVSLTGDVPMVLRPGFVTPEEMAPVLGRPVALSEYIQKPLQEGQRPQSPGMKYRHYAPEADITILEGSLDAFMARMRTCEAEKLYALCFEGDDIPKDILRVTYGKRDDAATQAEGLFRALRQLDALGAQIVYARAPKPEGVGLAVRNRLLRAAGFKVVTL